MTEIIYMLDNIANLKYKIQSNTFLIQVSTITFEIKKVYVIIDSTNTVYPHWNWRTCELRKEFIREAKLAKIRHYEKSFLTTKLKCDTLEKVKLLKKGA